MTGKIVTVVGAGVVGLWQALTLARDGHEVQLLEASRDPFAENASGLGGAMLSPFCEAETAEPVVRELGLMALPIWRETLPGVVQAGSLVVAGPRDQPELARFARLTDNHRRIGAPEIAKLEPDFEGRFASALYFETEAHMAPRTALVSLMKLNERAGVDVRLGHLWEPEVSNLVCDTGGDAGGNGNVGNNADFVIDCRGMAARDKLDSLRGVRGERLIIATRDVQLNRPVRLLHPRHPLYVVPWPAGERLVGRPMRYEKQEQHIHGQVGVLDGVNVSTRSNDTDVCETDTKHDSDKHDADNWRLYMVGSTLIESEDAGPMTVRSALELLGMTYALHPAFGEAQILDMSAGVRPAFRDNIPKVLVRGNYIHVNGMYRHGFLTAPSLARHVANYIATGRRYDGVFV